MTNSVPIDIEAARNEIESCGSLNEDIAADALDELEAARKVLANMQGRIEELESQVPPAGSGPWAIMQSQRGFRVRYGESIWEPNICEPPPSARCRLIESCGWSVVPDAKPMTFAEAAEHCFRGGRARHEYFTQPAYVSSEKHGWLSYHSTCGATCTLQITEKELSGKWFAC